MASLQFRTVGELQAHVKSVLCRQDRIDPTQAELHQARLIRGGKTCGILFQLRGPRLLRTYAIWSGDELRILFYESTGTRFEETKLTNALKLSDVIDESGAETAKAS